jgi:hypothetical protein
LIQKAMITPLRERVVDLFSRHLDQRHTLAWLLIIILLPFAGALLYWVLRRREAVGADSA